jgi:putative flippase GtrA
MTTTRPPSILMRLCFNSNLVSAILQLVRFGMVGLFNTLFGYGIIFLCMYKFALGPATSNAIGYGLGLCVSFTLHRRFTFRSNSKSISEPAKFLLVFALAYIANLAVLLLAVNHFEADPAWSQLFAAIAYVTTSFLLSKFFVFTR